MVRPSSHNLPAFFVWCGIALWAAVPVHSMELAFSPSAQISGNTLLLSDIATITPTTEDSTALLAKSLYVRPPTPGKTITLARVDLKSYLSHRYPKLADAKWTGAQKITVTRAAQTIGPEEIRATLEQYLQEQRNRYPDSDLKLVNLQTTEPFHLPIGTTDIEVLPANTDFLKTNRFTLLVRVNGRVEKNFSVFAKVEAMTPVVTVRRNIRRGQILSHSDLNVTVVDLAGIRQSPIVKMTDAVGKEARRAIRRGQVLEHSFIDYPTIIKRGELVLITARSQSLSVTAKGVALKDGKKDEVIGVKNLGSKKTLLTRVVAPGNVEVRF